MAYGVLSTASTRKTIKPASSAEREKWQAQGEMQKFTVEDVRRRLIISFGAVNGVEESLDDAIQKAQAHADDWKQRLDERGMPPTSDEYDRVAHLSFGLNAARRELSKKNTDGESHRELFAGRTSRDTEEVIVLGSDGTAISTRPRQRWEFTKSLLRDVLDPSIPDEELHSFIEEEHDDESAQSKKEKGGQGFVQRYPTRKLVTKHHDPNGGIDETNRTRFARESMTMEYMNRVSPETVPGFLGTGVDEDGRKIIYMEEISGATLEAQREDTSKMSDVEKYAIATKLVRLILDAINAGVVHRDLKGENIIFDRQSLQATLIDLGLARFRHNDGTTDRPDTETETKAGTFVGNVLYIAPEQARNSKKIDPRNDLFSLGLLVYEILTSQRARIPPRRKIKNPDGTTQKEVPDHAQLMTDVCTPGYKDKLPLLDGNQRGTDGKKIPELRAEGARAVEILTRRHKLSLPSQTDASNAQKSSSDDSNNTGRDLNTITGRTTTDNSVRVSFHTYTGRVVSAKTADVPLQTTHLGGTIDYMPSGNGAVENKTVDFDPSGNQKLETDEERAEWEEAKLMAETALKLLEKMSSGESGDAIFHYKRKANLRIRKAIDVVKNPWVIVAEALALLTAVTSGGAYMVAHQEPPKEIIREVEPPPPPLDPSKIIVREADAPDPLHFNTSSVVYADGSEDLVLQMPSSTGIAPDHLKTGVHFWRPGPDGKMIWIGGSTAIPQSSVGKYLGQGYSSLNPNSRRIFFVKNSSKFVWGNAGMHVFQPKGKIAQPVYRQLPHKSFPFVQQTQHSRDWNDLCTDPAFAELASIDARDVSVGDIDQKPFDDAGVDVYTKEKNIKTFVNNIKSLKSASDDMLKLKSAKAAFFSPPQPRHQFEDRFKIISQPRRAISAVQAEQYKERKNGA